MSVFKDHPRQLNCIYNGRSEIDKKTLAYLTASKKKLFAIDISKETLTGTQWAEIAKRLSKDIIQLIDPVITNGNQNNFDADDCITILRENPNALNGAIIFTTTKADQITNPSKAIRFFDSDSKVIPKK